MWCAAALIALLSALPASVRAQSCSCSANGTSCEKVKVGFAASVCSHHNYTVSLGGKSVAGSGSCTADTWMTTQKTEVELTLDKPYMMAAGTGSCATHVVFDVPDGYKVIVDGIETRTIDVGGPAKGNGDGNWQVVIHKCDECDKNEGVEECDLSVGSINWSVSLGKLSDGRSADLLRLSSARAVAPSMTWMAFV
jgi:hypothetical protein